MVCKQQSLVSSVFRKGFITEREVYADTECPGLRATFLRTKYVPDIHISISSEWSVSVNSSFPLIIWFLLRKFHRLWVISLQRYHCFLNFLNTCLKFVSKIVFKLTFPAFYLFVLISHTRVWCKVQDLAVKREDFYKLSNF